MSDRARSTKLTGLEWPAEIPSHWSVSRLGMIGEFVGGAGFPHEYQGLDAEEIPFFKVEDTNSPSNQVYLTKATNTISQRTAIQLRAKIVRPGAVVFPKVGAALLGNKRRILRQASVFDNNMMAFIPRVGCSKYLYYWLSLLDFGQLSNPGPVPSINERQVRSLPALLPPVAEQHSIADFLDQKTTAIDALIAKKERLIELIEEKRQATITRAVTKGLDPDVQMKDSGVEWLGEVPGHWEVLQTRFVARLESGHTPSRQRPEYWIPDECTIPWFTLADVWQIRGDRQEYLGDTAEKVSPTGLANSSARLLPAGTVVLSRTASVGFSGIMPQPMATTQDFVNWICGKRIRPEYLLYVFRAMRPEFKRLMMGSTHQTIYMPDVRSFRAPLPPVDEQEAIVFSLRKKLETFSRLAITASAQISKLGEYRQTLISAAVTGQLDLRSRTTRAAKLTAPEPLQEVLT